MKIITSPGQMQQERCAATIGMFDGFHLGHRSLVESLKEEASSLHLATAVVTFRDHPQNVLYGGDLKWICTLDDRIADIAQQGVDYLILMDFTPGLASLDSGQFMSMLHEQYGVDALVVGFNHHFGHNRSDGFECYCRQGKALGVSVLQAREYDGEYAPVSSSIIRRLIAEGDVEAAMHRLNHLYGIGGVVVHGMKNGRRLGYPTANVGEFSSHIVLPKNGVYASYASIDDGRILPSMTNIGTRPTVLSNGSLSVEVNIFDFDDDIYGRGFKVYLLRRLREERHFASLDDLKHQLASDCEESRRYLSSMPTVVMDGIVGGTR